MTERATIDTSAETKGPSVEESYEQMVKDGVIKEEATGESTKDTGGGQGDGVEADGSESRPSWLPEKFKSPEDLAKAYAELEKKQSSGKTEGETDGETKGETKGETEGETQGEAEGEAEAREAVENAGLDFDALSSEYDQNGQLSDGSYEALEKAGIPREIVDAYVSGMEAQAKLFESEVKGTVGGDESYSQMIEWGSKNLTDAEIDAFDEAVNSGDANKAKTAVQGLYARMQMADGSEPTRQVDGKGGSTSDAYESQAQVEADMNDPRYSTDPAFRERVYSKLSRSNL